MKENKETIILWIQSKTSNGNDILSVNGKQIDRDSKEYDDCAAKALCVSNENILLKQCDNLSIYRVSKNSYQIFSNFNELDEVGRRVCFMSYIQTNKNSLALLLKEASIYNYSLDDKDKGLILGCTNSHKIILLLVMTIVFISLILVVILL